MHCCKAKIRPGVALANKQCLQTVWSHCVGWLGLTKMTAFHLLVVLGACSFAFATPEREIADVSCVQWTVLGNEFLEKVKRLVGFLEGLK